MYQIINRFVLASLMLCLFACSSVDVLPTRQQNQHTSGLQTDNYLIGVDDRVEVNVWKNDDLSISVPVRPDGKISVPLIGEVVAGGRAPLDVAQEIKTKLASFVKDPHVSVILVELNSHEYLSRVRLTGAVRNPLSLTYRQGMTVLDVVLEAGGLNDFAAADGAKLFRKTQNGKVKTLPVYLSDILNDGDMRTNYDLEPGDIISVPERIF